MNSQVRNDKFSQLRIALLTGSYVIFDKVSIRAHGQISASYPQLGGVYRYPPLRILASPGV